MLAHLRANLLLLVLTVLVCSVGYPLALWGVGQAVFHDRAGGSLVGRDGAATAQPEAAVGSRLIAQPFRGAEYFQPRPSAVGYNAAASGGSNLAASNPALRDRVARTLGPIAEYREESPQRRAREARHESSWVAPDVVAWVQSKPDIVRRWARTYPTSAQAWVHADDRHKAAVVEWMHEHPEIVEAWTQAHGGEPRPDDLATAYFESHAAEFHRAWPKLSDDPSWSVPAVFFDMWVQEHPAEAAELHAVPADLVMTSGSGLDPHITLRGALFQMERVAAAWAARTGRSRVQVREDIHKLLLDEAHAPLGGAAGVRLVNVLEVNLALSRHFAAPKAAWRR